MLFIYFIMDLYKSIIEKRKKLKRQPKIKRDRESKNDNVTCPICLENEICVVFITCGHVTCLNCVSVLKSCHFCRKNIKSYIVFYLP